MFDVTGTVTDPDVVGLVAFRTMFAVKFCCS